MRNNSRKGPIKGKAVPSDDSEDKDSDKVHKGKKFCKFHGT